MLRYTLTTAPTVEPVTVTEAKQHLRIDDSFYEYETDLIAALIQTARELAEQHTRRAFITQTWTINLDGWPAGDEVVLPFSELISVTSVKHYDNDDTESTFTDYSVDTGDGGRIVLDSGSTWPTEELRPRSPIAIIFVAGYGAAASAVPKSIKQAILMMVGHLYENRERVIIGTGVNEIPFAVDDLLRSYRWW